MSPQGLTVLQLHRGRRTWHEITFRWRQLWRNFSVGWRNFCVVRRRDGDGVGVGARSPASSDLLRRFLLGDGVDQAELFKLSTCHQVLKFFNNVFTELNRLKITNPSVHFNFKSCQQFLLKMSSLKNDSFHSILQWSIRCSTSLLITIRSQSLSYFISIACFGTPFFSAVTILTYKNKL